MDANEEALLKNALGRSLCQDFSPFFDVIAEHGDRPTFQLTATITQVTPTNRLSAGVGALTRRLAPVGVRPPFGLGAMTVEFELARPDGARATAMVWSQTADIASSSARISTIGDAYGFTDAASSDFLGLVKNRTAAAQTFGRVSDAWGRKPDSACEKYGAASGFLERLIQLPPTLPNQPKAPQ